VDAETGRFVYAAIGLYFVDDKGMSLPRIGSAVDQYLAKGKSDRRAQSLDGN
jgi:hypothetical protein